MTAFESVLLRNRGVENSTSLSVYESRGGYGAARKALKMTPESKVACGELLPAAFPSANTRAVAATAPTSAKSDGPETRRLIERTPVACRDTALRTR